MLILLLAAAFGDSGQVVPSGSFSYSHSSIQSEVDNIVSFQPGVLVFLGGRFAAGLSLRCVYESPAPLPGRSDVFRADPMRSEP